MISIVYFSLTGERKKHSGAFRAMGARQRELGRAHFLRRLLHMLVHSAAFQRRDAGAALFQDLVVSNIFRKASILSGLPISSNTMLSGDRSMILAL